MKPRLRIAAALIALTAALETQHAGAAPQSVYSGDSFDRAAGTASTGAAEGVSIQSGTYSYTYPIAVPPGRLGMQPSIGLTYRSDGAIYGGLAAGWSLDV